LTPARRFAPQGVRYLADALSELEFADMASIALDWSNELGLQPEEAHKPFIIIETIKFVGERRLVVTVRLDVEDLFGTDEIQSADFMNVIEQMREKTEKELARDAG
jgi:hypothetical protein